MRFNLHLAYWSLLSVTCISSCFLFFLVAIENAKYVAASSSAATANVAKTTELPAQSTATTETPLNEAACAMHEGVLPNYKKVKKLKNYQTESHTRARVQGAAIPAVPPLQAKPVVTNEPADSAVVEEEQLSAQGLRKQAPVKLSSPPLVKVSEASAEPVNAVDAGNVRHDLAEEQHAKKEALVAEPVVAREDIAVEAAQQDDLQKTVTDSNNVEQSLPVITDIPTITVTELPLEVLEPTRGNLDALIIDAAKEPSIQEHENHTVEILENSNEAMQKDEQIIKINDSGGGQPLADATTKAVPSDNNAEHIPNETVGASSSSTDGASDSATPVSVTTEQQNASSSSGDGDGDGDDAAERERSGSTVNLTAEEVPIPVFSEWAQKQMEAAEKQQAKEQEVVNTSAQKKNHTNGNGKAPPLKMRSKNYASPDCGAKIIASNADATNTGAVLSSSKDEYMLSPCGNRIWFVVELCEAIQAQKIELANFELFSSSPKNFTVAVSNRFPTRDWSNVGRFIAEDKRNVQSFMLHPHLFGKFVRVDIHSHYSKEHFCPVSLFRVFGTSEFEAFETENQPDMDDFDDEFVQEVAHAKNTEPNLFKSASDAVLSIVKKAAEVLVKPTNNQNTTLKSTTQAVACRTPVVGQFNCIDCNRSLVDRINNVLSCELQQLNVLLRVSRLRQDLLSTQICAKQYGIETKTQSTDDCTQQLLQKSFVMDVKQSYFLNLLPPEYIGALCQLLTKSSSSNQAHKSHNTETEAIENEHDTTADLALNLTIDKKVKGNDFELIEDAKKKLLNPVPTYTATKESTDVPSTETTEPASTTTESSATEDEQLQRPPPAEVVMDTVTTAPEVPKKQAPDVNIFNVLATEQKPTEVVVDATTETIADKSGEQSTTATPSSTTIPTTTTTEAPPASSSSVIPQMKNEEDPNAWENLDNLLSSTTATPQGSTGTQTESTTVPTTTGVNLQQKIPSGPQSESVFIRLSNRIKALERNMSLSGQYLEELSRRYKKQVEELQLTLTQQMQTVRSLEEQNRRHNELEQLLAQRNAQLKEELDDLSLQVHACIVVVIFVGAFVFLVLMVSILFYRSMRRETKEVLAIHENMSKRKAANSAVTMQKKLNRRKSFEDFSDHQQTLNKSGERHRRPSEEALLILKEGTGANDSKIGSENVGDTAHDKTITQRERKISVCYSNGNVNVNNNGHARSSSANKRKGEKHSWPNTEHAQQQARKHLEQLHTENGAAAEYTTNSGIAEIYSRPRQFNDDSRKVGKTRKKSNNLRRQESAPSEYPTTASKASHNYEQRLNVTAPADIPLEYDESLLLDEEGLDNFIPTSDLAYNEFMPEGPSGYQVDGTTQANGIDKESTKAEIKKGGGFFKSPFSKSLKIKSSSAGKSKHPHESTSWEWYRSKKSEQQQQKQLNSSVSSHSGLLRPSPTASIDSSSLSEIHFPSSSTENSFRILEEAIMTSGESITGTTTGNGYTNNHNHTHNSGSSGASSSNRSSSSSTSTKKKSRSFNKIFRKVF